MKKPTKPKLRSFETSIKNVVLPDGDSFDEHDWLSYSDWYVKRPIDILALRLQVPVKIKTLEGEMIGDVGDWLIQGVNGEFYPCKDDIFKKSYQRKNK